MRYLLGIFPFSIAIVAILLIFHFLLSRTQFGQHIHALGGNIDAARRAGVPGDRGLIRVYMISSFFAALSGIMYTLRFVTGRADAGSARMLDSVVAVVIGEPVSMEVQGASSIPSSEPWLLGSWKPGWSTRNCRLITNRCTWGLFLILAVLINQFFPELAKKGE